MNTTATLAAGSVGPLAGRPRGLDLESPAHGHVSPPAQGRSDAEAVHDGERHAHDHDHDHGHAHDQSHGREVAVPGFSLVRASLATRLLIAGGLSALVWAAVLWALLPNAAAVLP